MFPELINGKQQDSSELFQRILEKTLLGQLFQGEIKQSLSCGSCGIRRGIKENFFVLSILLIGESLDSSLNAFFQQEIIEGAKCPNCRKPKLISQYEITKPPTNLCIQIKRFDIHGQKITKSIKFQYNLEIKDIS